MSGGVRISQGEGGLLRRLRAAPAWLAAALLLAGCAGGERPAFLPPVTPAETTAPPAPSSPPRVADREHVRLVAAFGGEYRAPALKRAIEEITAQLQSVAQQPGSYEVTLLDSPVVNAFALPSGRLYLTRGVLALANDKSEIASVIAHEIAHVVARHALERAQLQQRAAIVSRVVAEVLSDPVAGAVVQARSQVGLASFSRQQELEADELAVRGSARAGFDPYGASRFLVSLGRTTNFRAMLVGDQAGTRGMDILSTHPGTPERIQLTLATARQIAAPGIGRRDRDAWLQALDGLRFGEDPRNGVVRGRRYINPSLGVAFETPTGLTLEAGNEAVLGVGQGGAQAMRFDAVRLRAGQSLEDYVASGWIEGVTAGPIERREIAGLPVALTAGQGREWHFRLAAIQAGQRTYRFIFASRGSEAETERLFRRTVESFRQLSQAEAAAIKPHRLQVVVAGPGDTGSSLAARMAADERALDQFLLLNGLERAADVTPGQRYKIIVD